jgi:glycosyltransferase involved in cell wall biosynthesis
LENFTTLYLISCFHTRLTLDWSSCAFSMKSFRFSKMMKPLGYRVVEFSNYGSESEADEKVALLNKEEFDQHFPAQKPTDFVGNYATIATPGWILFDARLKAELVKRVKPGDIILHGFGRSHPDLPVLFPQCHHVEPFIGYPDKPFGCWRIYESNAWRSYHLGRWDHDASVAKEERGVNKLYSWVIPNFFDASEWPYVPTGNSEDYVAYLGRIDPCKGTQTMAEAIREHAKICSVTGRSPLVFKFAGQGDFEKHIKEQVYRDGLIQRGKDMVRIEYLGVLKGRERADFYGKARCAWLLTNYFEPFGGSIVEAQLCGTPAITLDYGCFLETVDDGYTGYRCRTLYDILGAIDASTLLRRQTTHSIAAGKFSMNVVGPQFDEAFRTIQDLSEDGWYHPKSHKISLPHRHELS